MTIEIRPEIQRAPGVALITNVDHHQSNPSLMLAVIMQSMEGEAITIDKDPLDAAGKPIPSTEMLAIRTGDKDARTWFKAIYFDPEIVELTRSFSPEWTEPKVESIPSWDETMRKRVMLQYWETASQSRVLKRASESKEKVQALRSEGIEPLSWYEMIDIVNAALEKTPKAKALENAEAAK